MAGTIYCFNCITDATIYKAGHTQQDLASRLRGYLGPSKPREIICTMAVDDSVRAEQLMLKLFRALHAFRERQDLGNEWFEAREEDREERHAAVQLVMQVVRDAVKKAPLKRPLSARETGGGDDAIDGSMPGMELYNQKLDDYIGSASRECLEKGVDALVDAFEDSDQCPVFVEYVRWSRDARIACARARHPHLVRDVD